MTGVVLVAAGRGTRMGPGVDKLFLEVAGRPVVAHTWSTINRLPGIDQVVVVVRDGMQPAFEELARQEGFSRHVCVAGGPERQDSVWNGLQALSPDVETVAIQDGARPCTSARAYLSTLETARRVGAAVTAQRVVDTLKEADDAGRVIRTIDRSRLWAVQTPQAFRVEVIRRALRAVRERGEILTDDTAACERIGQATELVESPDPNPKVTTAADLPYVATILLRLAAEQAAGGDSR